MSTDRLTGDRTMIVEPTAEEQDEMHALATLEAEQDTHDATVEAESDGHTVLRHTEFYPLDVDTRGWTMEEVDYHLGGWAVRS